MNKKRIGLIGVALGAAGAGVGVAVAARKYAVGRVRLRPDPHAAESFGGLRGHPLTVLADDGVPLHVEIDGAGKDGARPRSAAPPRLTVVFCHGYALNQDCWHYQRRDLRRDDRLRLVFWDQRSHGQSGRSELAHATIDQTGEDLYAVLRATVRPDEPVVLVGHSMGGMTIMALAERHPELFGDQIVGVDMSAALLDAHTTFRRVIQAAGLSPEDWSPRELRHSFVSLLSDSGLPIENISRLLGHVGTTTTETVYRKQIRPVIVEGAEVMDRIFKESQEG
jgi:pimeloyl-ACP methyl ester carboxylesterase